MNTMKKTLAAWLIGGSITAAAVGLPFGGQAAANAAGEAAASAPAMMNTAEQVAGCQTMMEQMMKHMPAMSQMPMPPAAGSQDMSKQHEMPCVPQTAQP